jgi:hypothetical protein
MIKIIFDYFLLFMEDFMCRTQFILIIVKEKLVQKNSFNVYFVFGENLNFIH